MPWSAAGIKPNGSRFTCSATHPIPHREEIQPTIPGGVFVQSAAFSGNRNCLFGEIQPIGRKRVFGLQHTVPRLGGATRLGNDEGKGGGKPRPDFGKGEIDPVGIGVVEEMDGELVAVWIPQGFSHKLGTEGRTADSNDQKIGKRTL